MFCSTISCLLCTPQGLRRPSQLRDFPLMAPLLIQLTCGIHRSMLCTLQGLPRPSQMREFLAVAATLFTRTIFGMSAYFRCVPVLL